MSEPEKAPISRRWLLRIGGLLGLGAAGVAVSGSASAAPGAGEADAPDQTGSFGKPASAETVQRQRRRAARTPLSGPGVAPGVATGPDPSTASGARLRPATTAIDHTALARRRAGGSWTTGG